MKRLIGLLAVLLLALPMAATAQNGNRQDHPKITGGGQVFIDDNGAQVGPGPGDTVAFTVHALEGGNGEARGQYRRIERDGPGKPTNKFFGIVTCVEFTNDDHARFGGVERDTNEPFTVDVIDNGQGSDAEDDVIIFRSIDNGPCSDDDSDDDEFHLARGNLKIHNPPDNGNGD